MCSPGRYVRVTPAGGLRWRKRARGEVEPERSGRVPARAHEQLLHLVGRHPFLTVRQLARLLGTTSARIRRLEDDLVANTWLQRVELDELLGATGLTRADIERLGLVVLTLAGRRRLAAWLGLDPTTATRYHGLIGHGRSHEGKRRLLLRALAHTLGANEVFVSFAVAADAVRGARGTDLLAEWRAGNACERRYCKPDGYGCYVRDGQRHEFFLEYDRGTEPARNYAAKLRAYYWYRELGQAARDYDGFPTLLFVTTEPRAEQRMAEQAYRAWFGRGTAPLPILSTTSARITAEGILGPIWQRLPVEAAGGAALRVWPPRGRLVTTGGGLRPSPTRACSEKNAEPARQ